LVRSCVGTPSKTRYWRKNRGNDKRPKEEEEEEQQQQQDVRIYWITFRKREDTVNWKRTH